MYGLHVMGYIGIALIISAISSPTIFGEDVNSNFIGRSSEDISQAILQNNGKNEANYIFSPFGYSVILGILSEGTRGTTREELTRILHLPEDVSAVRQNFRTTLQRLHERSADSVPEFRNFFYVYKNFTIEEDYKNTLLKNYYTDIRNVDRINYDSEDFNDVGTNDTPVYSTSESSVNDIKSTDGPTGSPDVRNHSNVIISSSTKSSPSSTESPTNVTTSTSEASSTSSSTLTNPMVKLTNNHSISSTTPGSKIEAASNASQVPIIQMQRKSAQKRSLKRGKSIDYVRRKRLAKRFLGINLEDTARSEMSSFSANRLNVVRGNSEQSQTKTLSRMIVFNGFYFKGSWKTPFQYKEGEEIFYKNGTEKISTKMMYTVGQFNIGQIPDLDSVIISLPYKGERYSFVIVLPNRKDGIQNLIARLKGFNYSDVHSKMEQHHVQISMPVFEFKTTSYLKESLKAVGVKRIFSQEADFSGLSRNSGLFVDDIVQFVTIKVDNLAGTPNFMTASTVYTRTVTEKFNVDHPFVFFIVDRKDDLILAAGQVYEPNKDDYIK